MNLTTHTPTAAPRAESAIYADISEHISGRNAAAVRGDWEKADEHGRRVVAFQLELKQALAPPEFRRAA